MRKSTESIVASNKEPTAEEKARRRIGELDRKVGKAFLLTLLILMTVGLLTLGTGMTFCLVYGELQVGCILCLVGILIAVAALPTARRNRERSRETVRQEILAVAETL